MEYYYYLCNQGILLNKKNMKKNINPYISIIIPIYNKEKYILRCLRSIQNQKFKDLEIIFIDDNSSDYSVKTIEELRKSDKRIILIRNKKNKGTLISRNIGILKSKGKYLFFIDPDDLISKKILITCYKLAEKYKYELIRFNIYEGNGKINLDIFINELINKVIVQPELSLYLFYGLGKLREIDYYITNKFIKREILIKSLNYIDKYFLNQFMIDCEDGLINFILYKFAKSYYFLNNTGYYYIINNQSITKNNQRNFQKRLFSNFLYLKFIFQYTKNNCKEKDMANYIFLEIYNCHIDVFADLIKKIKNIKFYKEIIDLYLNNNYITIAIKNILNNIS